MCAKVHTLPGEVINNYRSVVERAGFRIRRKSVAPYCAAELIKADGSIKPGSYFLVDMGAHITSISLIGNSTLFRSLAFPKGGDDLTEAIASDFGIPFEEAERLKVTYGYDTRVRSYKRPLAVTRGENGQERKRYQEDLNAVIVRFIDEYEALLINAINQLVEYENARKQDIMSLDIVFTGGASLLKGLDGLFARSLQSHKLHFFSPHVMGARDPRFTNCIGIIVAGGIYKGALEDMRGGVGGLSRGR
jgi:cell division protein FtsA